MSDPSDIINWRRISPEITLSGQPSEGQLADIRRLGVTHVVNLGPHHNKGALEDEAGTVAELGMEYIYIPVEFATPTDRDFELFCQALEDLQGKTIHIHCIYNARVTAFVYRYAKMGRGLSEKAAFELMDDIWRPGEDWADFIGDAAAKGQPNRYRGYDYD